MVIKATKSATLTIEEKEAIWKAAKSAAFALADFWDVLRDAEHAHGCTIEYTDAVESLAGEVGVPASFTFHGLDAEEFCSWLSFDKEEDEGRG
jgi:hypothetical protein